MMQRFLKPIALIAILSAPPTPTCATTDNFYDFMMLSIIKNQRAEPAKTEIFSNMVQLASTSSLAFITLLNSCEHNLSQVPTEIAPILQQHGFVDADGSIDANNNGIKALKEIVDQVHGDQSDAERLIYTPLVLSQLFTIYNKSLILKDVGVYQEKLLHFTFSFPNYHDLVQLFSEIFLEKEYYFKATNEKPLIIDCGGNLGMTILFFKTIYPASTILTFEPSRVCLPFLKKNISDNHLTNVTIIEKALTNLKGQFLFHEKPENTLGGGLYGDADDQSASAAEGTLLSDYINGPVDFLKVDVEGAETLIFEDLDRSGKIEQIKEMGLECHSAIILHTILDTLNKHHFLYTVAQEKVWPTAYMVHAFRFLGR